MIARILPSRGDHCHRQAATTIRSSPPPAARFFSALRPLTHADITNQRDVTVSRPSRQKRASFCESRQNGMRKEEGGRGAGGLISPLPLKPLAPPLTPRFIIDESRCSASLRDTPRCSSRARCSTFPRFIDGARRQRFLIECPICERTGEEKVVGARAGRRAKRGPNGEYRRGFSMESRESREL